MRSKHADELTEKDRAKIALVEAQFGKPIGQLLQRKRTQAVWRFAKQLGISVEQKRKWSRLILGQADMIQLEPCEDCDRLFRPTNHLQSLCDSCSYQRHVHECEYCGEEYAIFNPYEALWFERDGFCSEACARKGRSEKRQQNYANWFAVFWIKKQPEPIAAEELTGLPWEEARQKIITRDGDQCRNTSCLKTNNLRVHCVDGNKGNLDPQNFVTLCGRCSGYVTAYAVDIAECYE